jgi:hypothetical protein
VSFVLRLCIISLFKFRYKASLCFHLCLASFVDCHLFVSVVVFCGVVGIIFISTITNFAIASWLC